MTQAQYTAIQKARLIVLPTLPAELVAQWLKFKPKWLQTMLRKSLDITGA